MGNNLKDDMTKQIWRFRFW